MSLIEDNQESRGDLFKSENQLSKRPPSRESDIFSSRSAEQASGSRISGFFGKQKQSILNSNSFFGCSSPRKQADATVDQDLFLRPIWIDGRAKPGLVLQDSLPQPKSQGLFSKQVYCQDIYQANSVFQALNDDYLTKSRKDLSLSPLATRNKPIQNFFGPEVNLNLPNAPFIQKSNFFGKPLQKPSFLTSQLPEANIFSNPCQTAQPLKKTLSINHSDAWPATITRDMREDVNKQITGIRDFDFKKSLFYVNLIRPAIGSQANTDTMIEAKMSSDRKIDTEMSDVFMSCSFFQISEYVSGTANKRVIPSAEISNSQVKKEVSNNDQSLLIENVNSTEPKILDNQQDLLNRVKGNFLIGLKYTDADLVIDPILPNSSVTEGKYQSANQDSAKSNNCNQESGQDNNGHNIVSSKRGNLFGPLQDQTHLLFGHHRSSKIQHESSTHPEKKNFN